jgi:hypothetical protein
MGKLARVVGLEIGGSACWAEVETNKKLFNQPVLTVEWWDVLQTHLLNCTINTK